MTDSTSDAPGPHALEIFDQTSAGLTCRVCGSLVGPGGDYAKVHWDWHEATNGA